MGCVDVTEFLIQYQNYLETYQKFCYEVFGVNPILNNDNQIIELIFYRNSDDFGKKKVLREYYRANVSALLILSKKIIAKIECSLSIETDSQDTKTNIQYRSLIIRLLNDSLILINDYHKNFKVENFEYFSSYLSKIPDYSLFYDTCYELIHGGNPFQDPSEKNDCSPVLIRVMLELRLKWGLGILGIFEDKKPIVGMSKFFDVLKEFEESGKIKLAVRRDLIERVYSWANIFIHGGIRSYSWLPGIALECLEPLFNGNSIHRYCGIQVTSKKNTLDEFKEALIKEIAGKDSNTTKIVIEPYPFPPPCLNFDEYKSRSESINN